MVGFQVKHGETEWAVTIDRDSGSIFLNGRPLTAEVSVITDRYQKITLNGSVHHVLFEDFDKARKVVTLRINGERKVFSVKDRNDELLSRFGIKAFPAPKVNELRSPMPGLVIKVMVQPGDQLKKGDPLLVLEAMKMENVLKAPADVTVKQILAQPGQAVEKNAVLVRFDG